MILMIKWLSSNAESMRFSIPSALRARNRMGILGLFCCSIIMAAEFGVPLSNSRAIECR